VILVSVFGAAALGFLSLDEPVRELAPELRLIAPTENQVQQHEVWYWISDVGAPGSRLEELGPLLVDERLLGANKTDTSLLPLAHLVQQNCAWRAAA
jgi:hypothetical protein